MIETAKDPVQTKVTALQQALDAAQATAESADARYQCERLGLALRYSHAEAIRFAAYTIGRILATHADRFDLKVHGAYADLKTALEAAGHRI